MISGWLYCAGGLALVAGAAALGDAAGGGGGPALPEIPASWLTLLNTLGLVVVMILHAVSRPKRKARRAVGRPGVR